MCRFSCECMRVDASKYEIIRMDERENERDWMYYLKEIGVGLVCIVKTIAHMHRTITNNESAHNKTEALMGDTIICLARFSLSSSIENGNGNMKNCLPIACRLAKERFKCPK